MASRTNNLEGTPQTRWKQACLYVEQRPAAALLLVLAVGLALRLIMLPGAGFIVDQEQYADWAACGSDNGVFAIYTCAVAPNYPPLIPTLLSLSLSLHRALFGVSGAALADNPTLLAALKLPALLFETALICLLFHMAYRKAGVWWAALVSAAFYLTPGVMIVTAWWGQTDAIFSFLLLLTVYLLGEKQPRLMWLVFGLALLAKFQSVQFLPVLGVLSLRRFGWRETAVGVAIFVLVFALGELPYFLGSGEAARTPYGSSVNQFPYISNGGNTFWWLLGGAQHLVVLDSTPLFGGVTFFQAGLAALALGTVLICGRAWLLPERGDDYLLLAMAGFSFYMLPTQVGVRYLYPGLMFLALAMIRDRRLIVLFVVVALAFTHNIFDTVWLGIGLLYYPSRLLFWRPVHDAIMMTVSYVTLFALFLQPLWARRVRLLRVRQVQEG